MYREKKNKEKVTKVCHYAHQELFTKENINQDIWNDFFSEEVVYQSLYKSSRIFLVAHVAPECKLWTLPKPHMGML